MATPDSRTPEGAGTAPQEVAAPATQPDPHLVDDGAGDEPPTPIIFHYAPTITITSEAAEAERRELEEYRALGTPAELRKRLGIPEPAESPEDRAAPR